MMSTAAKAEATTRHFRASRRVFLRQRTLNIFDFLVVSRFHCSGLLLLIIACIFATS